MNRVWIVLALLGSGCSGYRAQVYHPIGGVDETLPGDVDALLTIADEDTRLGPLGPNLDRSRAAAEYALEIDPNDGRAAWRVARALFHLANAAQGDEAATLSARCIDVSAMATKNLEAVEAYYYQALCMGARAQVKSVEGLDLVEQMVASGKKALAIDDKRIHAGAHRLLGGIYLRAPAWPASVGDLDEAIEHLEQAVAIAPQWAENHLLLAEALLEDDRPDEARIAFDRARELMKLPDADGWREVWKTDVTKIAARLERLDP